MSRLLLFSAGLAILFHVAAFAMESLLWEKPFVRKIFRQDEAAAKTTRALAFNQGFYNLCLALGMATGLRLFFAGARAGGAALIAGCAGTMVVAACVLVATDRKFLRGALLQGLPPLAALCALWRLK